MAHVDFEKRLCVFTNASEFLWSGVVTRVPTEDLSLSSAEQRHEPLAFLSRPFRDAELHWKTLEKEAHAIMEAI